MLSRLAIRHKMLNLKLICDLLNLGKQVLNVWFNSKRDGKPKSLVQYFLYIAACYFEFLRFYERTLVITA